MSKVDSIVNKVFQTLSLQSSAEAKKFDEQFSIRPVISIARDPGSGGKLVAQTVAEKLGFTFYDEALIEKIAKSAKKRKDIIAQIDERSRSVIDDMVHNLFNPEYVSETTYVKHLTKVILSVAHQGKAVILGRGSNFVLPRINCLSVLVTAPRKVRIQRAMLHEDIKEAVAKKRIDKISKERKDFVSQYFNKQYSNPDYYDAILNTDYFDIDAASEVVISSFRKKFPTFGEKVKTTIKKTGNLY